jgi:DNA-nicking Smr family endonuclease
MTAMDDRPSREAAEPPVELAIDGLLDLHSFDPREVPELVMDYLAACREKGIYAVRLIHGKGTGALRETVHAALRRNPLVTGFRPAGEMEGGWGATVVVLRNREERKP